MDCSMPGFPVLHHLPELAQTHIHLWYHPTISSSVIPFSCFQSFPAGVFFKRPEKESLGSFPMSKLVALGGQNIGASASVSVFPVNSQGWFPLGLTWLDPLVVQGTLKSFLQHYNLKASILQCLAFFMVQLSQAMEKPQLDYMDLC